MKQIEKKMGSNLRNFFSKSSKTMVFVKWQSISGEDIGSFRGVILKVERSSNHRHLVDYHQLELEETKTISWNWKRERERERERERGE